MANNKKKTDKEEVVVFFDIDNRHRVRTITLTDPFRRKMFNLVYSHKVPLPLRTQILDYQRAYPGNIWGYPEDRLPLDPTKTTKTLEKFQLLPTELRLVIIEMSIREQAGGASATANAYRVAGGARYFFNPLRCLPNYTCKGEPKPVDTNWLTRYSIDHPRLDRLAKITKPWLLTEKYCTKVTVEDRWTPPAQLLVNREWRDYSLGFYEILFQSKAKSGRTTTLFPPIYFAPKLETLEIDFNKHHIWADFHHWVREARCLQHVKKLRLVFVEWTMIAIHPANGTNITGQWRCAPHNTFTDEIIRRFHAVEDITIVGPYLANAEYAFTWTFRKSIAAWAEKWDYAIVGTGIVRRSFTPEVNVVFGERPAYLTV